MGGLSTFDRPFGDSYLKPGITLGLFFGFSVPCEIESVEFQRGEDPRRMSGMVGDIPVEYVASLIAMLVVAAFSALLFRRIGFPITIGLVAVGIGLGLVVRHVDALSLMDSF